MPRRAQSPVLHLAAASIFPSSRFGGDVEARRDPRTLVYVACWACGQLTTLAETTTRSDRLFCRLCTTLATTTTDYASGVP